LIELQHINVKLLVKDQEGIDLEPLVPVFHSWIQEQSFEELLIDVADYRHVPDGPGVMVIGHEADYSLDQNDGRLGVRYNRKAILNSDSQGRLKQATKSALHAFKRLETDTRLNQKFHFNGRDVEVFINDRLLVPNSSENRNVLESEFRKLGDALFGVGNYELTWQTDPRRLPGALLKGKNAASVSELLVRLN
jgi:hypothetical protein